MDGKGILKHLLKHPMSKLIRETKANPGGEGPENVHHGERIAD